MSAPARCVAHLDCATGVSGDKFLGALLDAEALTAEELQAVLTRLAPEARVEVARVRSHGLAAVSVRVEAAAEPPHRSWRDVRALLHAAELAEPVLADAVATFELLADAEAAAHGSSADEVHFHEVGALDSILDVVGVAAAMHAAGIDRLHATPPALGGGSARVAHGTLAVPAPATAQLLIGMPSIPGPLRPDGSAPGELTTPTGAALLRVHADAFTPLPPCTVTAVGFGAGTRDIGVPNVCRLLIGDTIEADPLTGTLRPETVALLESNLDHLSPEAAAVAAEALLAEGALDVWTTPVVMKKGRAAFTLSALVPAEDATRFAERLVALTGSLGVRMSEQRRLVAPRELDEIATAYGPVRVKRGAGRTRPEADDVARIARRTGRAFSEVEAELTEVASGPHTQ